MQFRTIVMAASAALFSIVAQARDLPVPTGAWVERVQLVYAPDTKSVQRSTVRVWDPEPAKNLDFVWEPLDSGTLAADGTINGDGKLVWRIRGSASYDPNAVYSTYVGTVVNGRPQGRGRLRLRGHEVSEGSFVNGRLSGRGTHIDAMGNRYDGEFVDGKPHGQGRLASTSGEIFNGTFLQGLKHGAGETRLAGGATFVSRWLMGRETGRPPLVEDRTLGGLLKAQSGGDAGKVEISVAIEPRMTQQAENDMGVAYQHLVRDEDIAIYPLDEQMNNLWNGVGDITPFSGNVFHDRDWEYSPAFVEVDLKTTDGSRVKLKKLGLEVASSEAYRKPMLSLVQHVGCIGFRPSFSIRNDGWGAVRDMTLNVNFRGDQPDAPASRTYTRKITDFDEGIDVDLKDVLDEAGVDTATLEAGRYSCPSMDSIGVCKAQLTSSVKLGDVADHIFGDDRLFTTASGTLDYNWADDAGTLLKVSEPFRVDVSMAFIDTKQEAECGDGFGGSPQALRYQDVHFKVGEKDYSIDMPVRGNKNVAAYTARLKMQSEPAMSSFHQFAVAAEFADGSVRKSKPVSFFFLRPRLSTFLTAMEPPEASCFVPVGAYGC